MRQDGLFWFYCQLACLNQTGNILLNRHQDQRLANHLHRRIIEVKALFLAGLGVSFRQACKF